MEYIYIYEQLLETGRDRIWTWLGNRARLWLPLFRLCRLRTVRCYGWYSGHRLIILSTYLLMGARRLVALMSWVLALSRPTDWRRGKMEV